MTNTEALEAISKLDKACEAMEAAGKRIDELKAENASLRQAIADAEKPTNCRHCGGDANTICAGQCKSKEQEPVAWITPDGEGFRIRFSQPTTDVPLGWEALYTSPPQRQWVGLTDEQIKKDFEKWAKENYVQGFEPYGDSYHNGHTRNRWQGWLAAHRAIEAAHGIKGEA